jgi:hypothetical protein
MGQTASVWRTRVLTWLADVNMKDVDVNDLDLVAIPAALGQYSAHRPAVLVAETAGTGSPYVAVPATWAAGVSTVLSVEWPARRTPPEVLSDSDWQVTRDPTNVALTRIYLAAGTPSASEWVRITHTAPYPAPTADPAVDLVDAAAFPFVAALAAAYACDQLMAEASRDRQGALPTDFVGGQGRTAQVERASKRLRRVYTRWAGLPDDESDAGQASTARAPAYARVDVNPSSQSLFHLGVR